MDITWIVRIGNIKCAGLQSAGTTDFRVATLG